MVHMLPPLHRKRGKKRKRIPFHGIFSKFSPLNTTKVHQSYTVSLKVNNQDNPRRRAKYVTKCEEINIVPITSSQIGFGIFITSSIKLSITQPNLCSLKAMNLILVFKLHCFKRTDHSCLYLNQNVLFQCNFNQTLIEKQHHTI
jgi:hypothetical protein